MGAWVPLFVRVTRIHRCPSVVVVLIHRNFMIKGRVPRKAETCPLCNAKGACVYEEITNAVMDLEMSLKRR